MSFFFRHATKLCPTRELTTHHCSCSFNCSSPDTNRKSSEQAPQCLSCSSPAHLVNTAPRVPVNFVEGMMKLNASDPHFPIFYLSFRIFLQNVFAFSFLSRERMQDLRPESPKELSFGALSQISQKKSLNDNQRPALYIVKGQLSIVHFSKLFSVS